MIENIAKGRLGKFLKEVCLLKQESIMDPKKTVADVLKAADPELAVADFKNVSLCVLNNLFRVQIFFRACLLVRPICLRLLGSSSRFLLIIIRKSNLPKQDYFVFLLSEKHRMEF